MASGSLQRRTRSLSLTTHFFAGKASDLPFTSPVYKPACSMTHLTTLSREPGRPEQAVLASEYNFLAPSEVDAFNMPLYQYFREGPMHVAVAMGRLDVDRLVAAYPSELRRGARTDRRTRGGRWSTEHRQLLFELKPDLWLFLNSNVGCARVFSRDSALAESTAREIVDRFRVRRKLGKPGFRLLSMHDGFVSTTHVGLDRSVRRSEGELALVYGDDFPAWDRSLRQVLRGPKPGTVILRGPPGTGKTTYLRHLTAAVARTHRVFVLAAGDFEMLTSPKLVNFWADEGRFHGSRQRSSSWRTPRSCLPSAGWGTAARSRAC